MKHKNTAHDPRDTEINGKRTDDAGCRAEETPNRASRNKRHTKETSNEASRAKRRTRRLLAALAVVLLLDLLVPAAAFTFLFLRPAGGFSNPPVAVEVPDVTGLDETEAKIRLAAFQTNRS